jgi:hypothetical protein
VAEGVSMNLDRAIAQLEDAEALAARKYQDDAS